MNTLFFTWYFLSHWTWDIIDLDEHAFLYVALFISLNMRHYWLEWTRFSLCGTFYLIEHETLLTWMNTLFFTWHFLSHWTWDIIDLDEHAFLYVVLFISLNMRHYWLWWTRFSLRGTFYLTEHETLLTWMNTLFFTWYFLSHWTWDIIDLDEHAFLYVVLFISLNMRHYWLGWTRFSLRGTFYLTEHETLLTWMNTLFFTWHFLSHWTWDIIDLDEHAFLYVELFNSLNMRHYWLGWTRFSLRGTFYLTEHETLLTWMNTLFFTWHFLTHWTWDIIDLDEHAFLYVALFISLNMRHYWLGWTRFSLRGTF